MPDATHDMIMILGALDELADSLDRKGPEDLVPPGAQVPMFTQCFHCGTQAYKPSLPHRCSCGNVLRRMIELPDFSRGPRWFRLLRAHLWLRKELFKSAFLNLREVRLLRRAWQR